MNVNVLVLDGVLDSSMGIAFDVLHAADKLARANGGAGLAIQAVSASSSGSVRTGSGLHVGNLVPMLDAQDAEAVLIPGSNVSEAEQLRAWLGSDEVLAVQAWLRSAAPRMRHVAGGCVASFVMAGCGLLDGHCATTTWWLAREFQHWYPQVRLDLHRMVVDDGKYITAGAALAQADLTLHVVGRLCGPTVASLCTSYMLVDERSSQAHYAILSRLSRQDPDVLAAEKWIRGNMERQFSIAELAEAVHLTPRTLARRFFDATGTTPYDFVQRIRIERATGLLRTTKQPLKRIAEQVGYQDIGALRRVFKRFGYPVPSQMRQVH